MISDTLVKLISMARTITVDAVGISGAIVWDWIVLKNGAASLDPFQQKAKYLHCISFSPQTPKTEWAETDTRGTVTSKNRHMPG